MKSQAEAKNTFLLQQINDIKTPSGQREFSPGQVTELRVYGAADNFTSDAAELLCSVTERHNLSGAHKCEIQGVEEEDHIFP